jgi:drug/metabolite transporter (DMT)-like permease
MENHPGDALSAAATTDPKPSRVPFSRPLQIALVVACTILGAMSQVLFKIGLAKIPHLSLLGVLLNLQMMIGLSLYGIFTLLMVLALRDGELSTLFPIISLTFVWVTLLSVWWFGESMNPFKALGVATIVLGVALLGKGGKK